MKPSDLDAFLDGAANVDDTDFAALVNIAYRESNIEQIITMLQGGKDETE